MGPVEFLEKLNSDKEFAKKYSKLESLEAVLAQAKADGYTVSEEDALDYIAKVNDGGLSEEELASVAGGKGRASLPESINKSVKSCSLVRARAGLHC
jgi:predicted ribosomally synthesized peptide with nif11-like leader